MIKVQMHPSPELFDNSLHESGIRRVVEQYAKYFPKYDIELVSSKSDDYDLRVVHAGAAAGHVDVAMIHGLYWSNDYHASAWEHSANANIVDAVRVAKQVTVPSAWVAETFQRDMRFSPTVVPHGIDWWDWEPGENYGYVLWNKNRDSDVCTPQPMYDLAKMNSEIRFVTTKSPKRLANISITGVVPHAKMKEYIRNCGVYLSTTKETFGIGVLEAMAAGKPVLGFDWGGNRELIQHGVNGYLARINDMQDLHRGLQYCMENYEQLGANGRELVKQYSWEKAVEIVVGVFEKAMQPDDYSVSVVIPSHNYGNVLERAVDSAENQSMKPKEVIVINDRSTDNTEDVCRKLSEKYDNFRWESVDFGNVADSRNRGIELTSTGLICCLDADDQIAHKFLEACVEEGFKKDRSLGIAYTGLLTVKPDGTQSMSPWPTECDYDKQFTIRGEKNFRGMNQIPTCNVFKKEAWRRTGGFKRRYSPLGAGSEDAEFWTRIMSIGYGAKKVSDSGLFIYSFQSGLVSGSQNQDPNLVEPHWLIAHPWAVDHKHPFASRATPSEGRNVHLVRQYDQPVVSVIIPVGPGHETILEDAIESVESQSFRRWELIVVWDSDVEPTQRFLDAYPFVRMIRTGGNKGAGYSRNRGAEISRAEFLVFLDADDRIAPNFLERTLQAWNETKSIIYTDYLNSSITSQEGLDDFNPGDVEYYNTATQEVLVRGKSADYDCDRAQRQPNRGENLFHWCLVTCLVPKDWHDAIGGFDEGMESFEDVLYHWMMARKGFCYARLPEHLVVYRIHTGMRREKASIYTEEGKQVARNMLEYAESVLKGTEMAGCSGCSKNRVRPQPARDIFAETQKVATETMRANDQNYVSAEYTHPNRGFHPVYGAATGEFYGRRRGGDVFLVDKRDIAAQPQFFRAQAVQTGVGIELPQKEIQAPPPPPAVAIPKSTPQEKPMEELPPFEIEEEVVFDIAALPGVTPGILKQLQDAGVETKEDILALGKDGLMRFRGIAEARADGILEFLSA